MVLVVTVNAATAGDGGRAAGDRGMGGADGAPGRMNAPSAAVSGLQAALLLARGRSEGVQHVDDDLRVAARSFWAAAVALPAFLCLRLLDWASDGLPPHPGHAWALDLLFYVIGWAGFAVLSRSLVAALGRSRRWPRFITVWNWCNVVQYLLLVRCRVAVAVRRTGLGGSDRGAGRTRLGAVAGMVCCARGPGCLRRGGGRDGGARHHDRIAAVRRDRGFAADLRPSCYCRMARVRRRVRTGAAHGSTDVGHEN